MSLWEWSVAAYARPGVEAACLELQDAHGQNVPLLLWAAWAKPQSTAEIGQAVEIARAWDAAAVQPLRAARRGLKAPVPGIAAQPREALRQVVKTAELQAERVLLEALEQLGGGGRRDGSLQDALAVVARSWSGAIPDEALAALAAGLA